MIRKSLIAVVAYMVGLVGTLTFAHTHTTYTPDSVLQTKLVQVSNLFESMIDEKGPSYRTKILDVLDTFSTRYANNERATYILSYLIDVLTLSVVEGSSSTRGFLGTYTIDDAVHGTVTSVVVEGDTRTITTNALPNHDTGTFPNEENPNTMSAQENSYELPIGGEFRGSQAWQREPGIAVNGIKFEPETNERVNCESGETYRIEGKQSTFPVMGIDHQNAHVQPTGTYHYHGISQGLVDFADQGDDIIHVGFAKDGYNIYYSRSGVYSPSFQISEEPRVGTSCDYRGTEVSIDGTTPDGTYGSDWVFDESIGDLDSCNGIEIDGEYMYFATDTFPYLPRCLNGEVQGGGPGGGGQGGPGGAGGPPPGGGQGGPGGPRGAGGPPRN